MPNAKGDLVSGGKPITETRPFILVRSRPRLSCPSTAPWTPSPYPDRYCSREPPCRWRWWPTSVSGDRSSKGGGMVVERGAFVQAIFGVGGSLRNPGAVATGSDSAPTTRPAIERAREMGASVRGGPAEVRNLRGAGDTISGAQQRHRGDRTDSDRHGPATSATATRPARGSGGPRSSCRMALGPKTTMVPPPLGSDLVAQRAPRRTARADSLFDSHWSLVLGNTPFPSTRS